MRGSPFARAWPTFIENWPDAWAALAPEAVSVTLDRAEMRALGAAQSVWGRWFGPLDRAALAAVRGRVAALFALMPEGGALRLGSRSGKDADLAIALGMRACTVERGFALLTDGSKRLAWDLRDALAQDYPARLYLRRWVEAPDWGEVRCFIRRGRCIGASAPVGAAVPGAERRRVARAVMAMTRVMAGQGPPDHVADLLFPSDGGAPVLLDVNPFHPLTGAGYFAWTPGQERDGDFDESLRVAAGAGFVSLPLDDASGDRP